MKTALRILLVAVITLVVFWPWFLHWADLVWLVLYQKQLTYGYWWDAAWAGDGYQYWPILMSVVMASIFGAWFAVGKLLGEKV